MVRNMGYCSKTALVIKRNVYEDTLREALQNPLDAKYDMLITSKGEPATDALKLNDDYAVLYWEWVKWYEEFDGVKFIEELRQNNDSYFIRIGEAYDDAETLFNGDDDNMYSLIDLKRSIDISI